MIWHCLTDFFLVDVANNVLMIVAVVEDHALGQERRRNRVRERGPVILERHQVRI